MFKISIVRCLTTVKSARPHDKEVVDIINYCRLQPSGSWRIWTDFSENVLYISKDAVTLSHRNSDNLSWDLYSRAPVKSIADKSIWAAFFFSDISHCFFIDKEQILRYRSFSDHWIKPKTPLSAGMKMIRAVFSNLNWSEYTKINSYENAWAGCWPPSQEWLQQMKTTPMVEQILNDCI